MKNSPTQNKQQLSNKYTIFSFVINPQISVQKTEKTNK